MGKSIRVSSSFCNNHPFQRHLSNPLDYVPTALKTDLSTENTNTEDVHIVPPRKRTSSLFLQANDVQQIVEGVDSIEHTVGEIIENQGQNEDTCGDEIDVHNEEYFQRFYWSDDSDDSSCEYDLDQYNLTSKQYDTIERYDLEAHACCRSKRSHKKMNAKQQIKTKHAKTIKINSHNKHLYVNHRLLKGFNLDPPSLNYMPSSTPVVLKDLPSYDKSATTSLKSRPLPQSSRPTTTTTTNAVNHNTPYRLQDYAVDGTNIPHDIHDDEMVTFLLEMQNRELSPEDYEMLCRLDERVERKTVNNSVLDSLQTVCIENTNDYLDEMCTICMEKYQLTQLIKLLPCKHKFHQACIETWLKSFSPNCPLDNLPLQSSV
ncbi:unnamed protein product [Didymodactylos carnosus]|uniref:RING-type domain-containing protein n=1 Tax=Didymodactylos carnosus TaxID=1234261 RepID=A0A814Y829_9BILA|nr:unnamed protein product [Didymodactylos carnosus]CAF3988377.1 unnamed protein product [Didymodactylos carnosus]